MVCPLRFGLFNDVEFACSRLRFVFGMDQIRTFCRVGGCCCRHALVIYIFEEYLTLFSSFSVSMAVNLDVFVF